MSRSWHSLVISSLMSHTADPSRSAISADYSPKLSNLPTVPHAPQKFPFFFTNFSWDLIFRSRTLQPERRLMLSVSFMIFFFLGQKVLLYRPIKQTKKVARRVTIQGVSKLPFI